MQWCNHKRQGLTEVGHEPPDALRLRIVPTATHRRERAQRKAAPRDVTRLRRSRWGVLATKPAKVGCADVVRPVQGGPASSMICSSIWLGVSLGPRAMNRRIMYRAKWPVLAWQVRQPWRRAPNVNAWFPRPPSGTLCRPNLPVRRLHAGPPHWGGDPGPISATRTSWRFLAQVQDPTLGRGTDGSATKRAGSGA